MQLPNNGVSSKTLAKEYSGSVSNGALYNIHSNLNVTGVTPTLTCVNPASYPNLNLPPVCDL